MKTFIKTLLVAVTILFSVFATGKYRWHGSAEAYTGREVQDIPGVLAVFAERRKDSFGPYVRLMSVTLN
ncbi:DUF987 domain-containing protein [Escherichia coli]|nr:DUF987 domain-containing protein [Escherichia coli]